MTSRVVPREQITFTLREATSLLAAFGGDDAELNVWYAPVGFVNDEDGKPCESAAGLYAHFADYPEEGCVYLGPCEVQDEPATPFEPDAAPACEPVPDAELDDIELHLRAMDWPIARSAIAAISALRQQNAELRALVELAKRLRTEMDIDICKAIAKQAEGK